MELFNFDVELPLVKIQVCSTGQVDFNPVRISHWIYRKNRNADNETVALEEAVTHAVKMLTTSGVETSRGCRYAHEWVTGVFRMGCLQCQYGIFSICSLRNCQRMKIKNLRRISFDGVTAVHRVGHSELSANLYFPMYSICIFNCSESDVALLLHLLSNMPVGRGTISDLQ